MGGHTDNINTLALSLDDTLLVSGSDDGRVRVWNIAGTEPAYWRFVRSFVRPSPFRIKVTSVAINQDKTKIFRGDSHGDIKIWDISSLDSKSWHFLKTLPCLSQVRSLAISPDNKHLYSGSEDSTMSSDSNSEKLY